MSIKQFFFFLKSLNYSLFFLHLINTEVQNWYHYFWKQRPLNWQQEYLSSDA